jgi:predicted nucleic acid-binding protein
LSLVIDASVALKWVLEESGSDAAQALRDERITAPSIWLAEAANALWRHVRLGEITQAGALGRFALLQQAGVKTTSIDLDVTEALRLAADLDHPIYDCLYLAAALRQDTSVITADKRFASLVAKSEFRDRVKLLGAATQ